MSKIKIKLQVLGDAELRRKLELLGSRARAAVMQAARAGAEPIMLDANRSAPGPHIITGKEKQEGGRAEISIGPDKEHWHYQFTETGADRHEIKGKPLLVFEGRKGLVITKVVKNHPGIAARPFLRPAADNQKDAARDAAGKVFRAEVDKLVIGK